MGSFLPRAAWKRSLQARLSGALILIAALTVLLSGFWTIRYAYDGLKRQKQQDELVLAQQFASDANDDLNKAKNILAAVAADPAFQGPNRVRQKDVLTMSVRATDLIDGMAVTDLKGRLEVDDDYPPATKDLLPADVYGSFVKPLVERGAEVSFGIFRTAVTGEPSACVSVPLRRGGRLSAVLTGMILLKNHGLGYLARVRIGRSGYAYLVDASGRAIVEPKGGRFLEDLRDFPTVKAFLANRRGAAEVVNKEGVPLLVAFAPIAETGWGVIVRQPAAESYAYARSVIYSMGVIFMLSLLAASALGVYLGRRILRPLQRLLEGVRRVGEGKLEGRIPVEGEDEFGALAAAFNRMAEKLAQAAARTRLDHERVLKAREALHQAEKLGAVGRLAAGLAHEIFNPLNIISGFAELLAERTPPAHPNRQPLEDIGRETKRCQTLVSQLLTLAKPKPPERRPTELDALLKETLELVRLQARTQAVELREEVEGPLPPLAVDRDQIKQVLLNLLLNACQAAPKGGRVTVGARRSGPEVEISVADTGPGIRDEDLPNLFTPFYTTKDRGTGLGLATSHAILRSHGGTIRVDSRVGRGTVFAVRLPLLEEAHG